MRGYLEISVAVLTRSKVYKEVYGATEGESVKIVFNIENRSLIPLLFVELVIEHSEYIKRTGVGRALAMILPRDVFEYTVVFEGRVGRHRIGPLKAVVRDPLGLYRSVEVTLHEIFYIEIFPRVQATTLRRLYSYARGIGYTRSRESGEGVEFRSVREYRPGDDIRRIVWRKYAQFNRLIVKEMERESSLKILYLILCSPDMFKGVYLATPYEQVARVVSSIARYAAYRSDYQAIILALPHTVYSSERFERGYNSYLKVMRVLSKIDLEIIFGSDNTSVFAEDIMSRVEMSLSRILSRESVLVLIFADATISERESVLRLVDILRSSGHRVLYLMPVRSLYDIKALRDEATLIYRIKIASEVEREKSILRRLRSRGIDSLALSPDQMVYHIMSRIEAYRY